MFVSTTILSPCSVRANGVFLFWRSAIVTLLAGTGTEPLAVGRWPEPEPLAGTGTVGRKPEPEPLAGTEPEPEPLAGTGTGTAGRSRYRCLLLYCRHCCTPTPHRRFPGALPGRSVYGRNNRARPDSATKPSAVAYQLPASDKLWRPGLSRLLRLEGETARQSTGKTPKGG